MRNKPSKVPSTERSLLRVVCPVGARCALCGLHAQNDGAVTQLDIMYGGHALSSEGNELAALWKHLYLCSLCIATIRGTEE